LPWRFLLALTPAALALATIGAYVLVGQTPTQTPDEAWFLFLSGAFAICAMILPGISGAFILVLLRKYQFVLDAVVRGDLITLVAPQQSRDEPRRERRDGVRRRVWHWLIAACCRSRFSRASARCCKNSP
jgi:hypothetical protein